MLQEDELTIFSVASKLLLSLLQFVLPHKIITHYYSNTDRIALQFKMRNRRTNGHMLYQVLGHLQNDLVIHIFTALPLCPYI